MTFAVQKFERKTWLKHLFWKSTAFQKSHYCKLRWDQWFSHMPCIFPVGYRLRSAMLYAGINIPGGHRLSAKYDWDCWMQFNSPFWTCNLFPKQAIGSVVMIVDNVWWHKTCLCGRLEFFCETNIVCKVYEADHPFALHLWENTHIIRQIASPLLIINQASIKRSKSKLCWLPGPLLFDKV